MSDSDTKISRVFENDQRLLREGFALSVTLLSSTVKQLSIIATNLDELDEPYTEAAMQRRVEYLAGQVNDLVETIPYLGLKR
jgi:hypothetical protein